MLGIRVTETPGSIVHPLDLDSGDRASPVHVEGLAAYIGFDHPLRTVVAGPFPDHHILQHSSPVVLLQARKAADLRYRQSCLDDEALAFAVAALAEDGARGWDVYHQARGKGFDLAIDWGRIVASSSDVELETDEVGVEAPPSFAAAAVVEVAVLVVGLYYVVKRRHHQMASAAVAKQTAKEIDSTMIFGIEGVEA